MICDDNRSMAEGLVAALRAAGHEAETCRHTMDMLRGAAAGEFDLIAFGLDMAGFGRAGAVEVLREIAPRVPLIALHERPSEIIRTPGSVRAQFAAVLPRSLAIEDFMYAVACALREPTTRRREPAA
jgi:DNA-binding NtrC family response regulator